MIGPIMPRRLGNTAENGPAEKKAAQALAAGALGIRNGVVRSCKQHVHHALWICSGDS